MDFHGNWFIEKIQGQIGWMMQYLQSTSEIGKCLIVEGLVVHWLLTFRAYFTLKTKSWIFANAMTKWCTLSFKCNENTIQTMNIHLTNSGSFRTCDQILIEWSLWFQVWIVTQIISVKGLLSWVITKTLETLNVAFEIKFLTDRLLFLFPWCLLSIYLLWR